MSDKDSFGGPFRLQCSGILILIKTIFNVTVMSFVPVMTPVFSAGDLTP